MRLAIISDSHDNIPNLEKALAWLKAEGVSLIIHCGDLCAPSILTEVLAPNFYGEIHLIHGNVGDRELLSKKVQEFKNVKLHGDFGRIEVKGKKIAFVHKPDEGKKLATSGLYDLVFYGHTHKPWIEEIKTKGRDQKVVYLANPGNLAGMFYKATFATYDTEANKLELKILEKL
ncbi:hypothetical protein COW09_00765 [bacterium (Candidatus Moisslbacteria) CG12_big_fil_rev_8_21_14_0_65_36_11]|nr:metallophosphoesterase family protein [Candidatus Kuenenbacteria bacterium]OIP76589.1 MAG: hypothetical protein AUK09_01380 [Parcubacteria group bacterium CG2_30_36_38]PIV46033.1 MAG: hypothetical protein COS23_01335 [bacterium (Candidatus Moisslbacteria) CG02_land_8_20_14_3_00_36_53]PIW68004.1 MAG: hypothetical protein COW09_00765 [bacterium (Candidatus Moisslbacteria) CG12_big_fil_rev_8_21_14_0_65_36_11]PIZ90401.1 MAG: hypothetical protein COX87_00710 [bacterium (Candidatus Moisslbacteria)